MKAELEVVVLILTLLFVVKIDPIVFELPVAITLVEARIDPVVIVETLNVPELKVV